MDDNLSIKLESEKEAKNIIEYIILSNNRKYQIKLGKLIDPPKIVFYAKEINILKQFSYKSEFSLNDLKKISKLFRIFDTIEEAFINIDKLINSQKIEIKEGLNEMNLNLTISNIHSQIENVCFKIKKCEDFHETKKYEEKEEDKISNFLIKNYPKEVNILQEKQIIINIIKINFEMYCKIDNDSNIKNSFEELNKNIFKKKSVMEMIIELFKFLLKFYKINNDNLNNYTNLLIFLYEYASNEIDNKKYIESENNNIKDKSIFITYGKIFEKDNNNLVILNDYDKIIFINDEEHIIKNEDENKFMIFSFLQLMQYNEKYIYYKTTKYTKVQNENINEEINKKILIKLNCIDYKDINIYNKIRITCSNSFSKDIDNKVIYFTFYEPKFSQEYFPQKIQLYSEKNIYNFVILILKGYCNEINMFLNTDGGYAYEYYYISKDWKYLPNYKKIKIDNNNYLLKKLWNYETTNRKKITFVNIPIQEEIEKTVENKNSFLKIYKCGEKHEIEYGTFLLNNLNIYQKQKVEMNKEFINFSQNLIDDVKNYIKDKINLDYLYKTYLFNYKNQFDEELKEDYRLYYFPNDEELFNYFNKLCIWNIFIKIKNHNLKCLFVTYFDLFEEINKADLNFTDKIILLITLVRRALENELTIFPKIKFFNKNNIDNDAYTKAFYFHLDLIESLNEKSKLVIPFLQLNSYIMDKILTKNEINDIKSSKIHIINSSKESEEIKKFEIEKIENENLKIMPAYTISMLSVNTIKKHLKNTMKPYCLIFGLHSNRCFLASVKKDNCIICFNEEEIVGKNYYISNLNLNDYSKYYKPDNIDDYAFIINILFLHENSSHNKEKVININVESPIIYLNENYLTDIIVFDNINNEGEAGYFVESFIGSREVINGLTNPDNKLGSLLIKELFNQENFDELLGEFRFKTNKFEDNSILTNYRLLDDDKINKNKTKTGKRYLNEREKIKFLLEQAKKTFSDY